MLPPCLAQGLVICLQGLAFYPSAKVLRGSSRHPNLSPGGVHCSHNHALFLQVLLPTHVLSAPPGLSRSSVSLPSFVRESLAACEANILPFVYLVQCITQVFLIPLITSKTNWPTGGLKTFLGASSSLICFIPPLRTK